MTRSSPTSSRPARPAPARSATTPSTSTSAASSWRRPITTGSRPAASARPSAAPARSAARMRPAPVCDLLVREAQRGLFQRLRADRRARQPRLPASPRRLHLRGRQQAGRRSDAGADIGRPFEPDGECRTLAEYRTRYASTAATRCPGASPGAAADLRARRPRAGRRRLGRRLGRSRPGPARTVERAPRGRLPRPLGVAARAAARSGRPDARLQAGRHRGRRGDPDLRHPQPPVTAGARTGDVGAGPFDAGRRAARLAVRRARAPHGSLAPARDPVGDAAHLGRPARRAAGSCSSGWRGPATPWCSAPTSTSRSPRAWSSTARRWRSRSPRRASRRRTSTRSSGSMRAGRRSSRRSARWSRPSRRSNGASCPGTAIA